MFVSQGMLFTWRKVGGEECSGWPSFCLNRPGMFSAGLMLRWVLLYWWAKADKVVAFDFGPEGRPSALFSL